MEKAFIDYTKFIDCQYLFWLKSVTDIYFVDKNGN